MYESFLTPEHKKSREEVLEVLKTKVIEDPETKEALTQFIEASRLEVEKITDKKEHYKASIECSIANAQLFYEAGYAQEAFDDLLDTREIAQQAQEEALVQKIDKLLDEIESKLG